MQYQLIVTNQQTIWYQFFQQESIKIGHRRGITDPVIQKFETSL